MLARPLVKEPSSGMEPCCSTAYVVLFCAEPTSFFPCTMISFRLGDKKQGSSMFRFAAEYSIDESCVSETIPANARPCLRQLLTTA
jgi:hypothetical protein